MTSVTPITESDYNEDGFQPEDLPEDELTPAFVNTLISRILEFQEVLVGYPLHPYQLPFARRIIESVIINDGEEITAQAARQSGKSETIANTVATLMVLLPKLATMYPDLLSRYKDGLWVGLFAPVEGQVETLFTRVMNRLTSPRAQEILGDPEIDDEASKAGGVVRTIRLKKSGSFVSMMTANPKAKIESRTFHLVVIDECFPAETPVLTSEGWVPIGEIVNGDRRDWMVAAQSSDDSGIEWARVTGTYRTPRHSPLVRVDHEYGSVYCTANHPFLVGSQEVPAVDLPTGAPLSLVPGSPHQSPDAAPMPQLLCADLLSEVLERDGELCTVAVSHDREAQPSRIKEYARQESYARPIDQSQDGRDAEADWTPPQGAGRQWSGNDRATAETLALATRRMGGRACVSHWRTDQGRSSYELQDRHRAPGEEDRRGDRRRLPSIAEAAGAGPAQGRVAVQSRVVGVEVLQPGSPEFDQFSDRADYVYTLEVDHPSHTYVANGIVVANCQGADDTIVAKSIGPMLAYHSGTLVKSGTPSTNKNNFYRSIQRNKRRQTGRGSRQQHFEWDWKAVAKVNPNYGKFVKKEMLRIGEDSDEFQMSYAVRWILERGMFVTEGVMDHLADKSMEIVKHWHKSPVVVGIDPARKLDSTVVTVVWVDWDRPDEFGYYDHRVLNWLELQGEDWEQQYAEITEFLANYDVLAVAVDANGVGDAVAQRLKVLLPRAEVIPITSSPSEQSGRFKHLQALIQRQMIGWPGHAKTRRLRSWKRFMQQMIDAERHYQGANFTVRAPDEAWAHDDYVDSLAIACSLTKEYVMPTIEVSANPFF